MEQLEKQGLADNTVVIYTSDHGFYLGEYGYAGKWYAHDVSIRIPLVVFDPRLPAEQKGTRRDQWALSIDMAPTMLDIAGVKIPQRMQGQSLKSVIAGNTPTETRSEFFYEHNFDHARIPRSEGVRTPRWKYARYLDSQPLYEELYDLNADPDEEFNLADKPRYAKTLATMRDKWEAWRKKAK